MDAKKLIPNDIVLLESGESSEDYLTDWEVKQTGDDISVLTRRKLYRIRFKRTELYWLKEQEVKEKEDDLKK